MIIRKFKPQEAEAIIRLTLETFYEISIARAIDDLMGGQCGETTWKDRKAAEVWADLEANPDGVYVAEKEGEVIGFITCLIDRPSQIAWIHHMAVTPQHQGKGIGKQLMQAALEYARAEGMTCCRIETMENNMVGQRFYPAVGFQEIARQIYYAMRL